MNNPLASKTTQRAGGSLRRWRGALFFAGWTVLAALAAWWLLEHKIDARQTVISTGNNTAESWKPRLVMWLTLAHFNFHWMYAWVLLAPYILWLGARFNLESRRWWWRLPLLLAAGTGFVLLAQAFNRQLQRNLPQEILISTVAKTYQGDGLAPGGQATTEGLAHTLTGKTPDFPPLLAQVPTNATHLSSMTAYSSVWPYAATNAGTNTSQLSVKTTHSEVWTHAGTNIVLTTVFTNARAGGKIDNQIFDRELLDEEFSATFGADFKMPAPTIYVKEAGSLTLDALTYGLLLCLAHGGLFYGRYRERERQAVLLENRLNEARLHTLQAQLQPHFLFNALNGIATLVRRDPAAAEEMITSLSDLLRLALGQSRQQEIPLAQELDFLNRYLEIQQMRFQDRLSVGRDIEPAALACAVPALLLQPLVENAIRHGLEPSGEPGMVSLRAARHGDRLVLTVEDNGVGLGQGGVGGTGVGLTNVRERLAALYPGGHEFAIGDRPGGGVTVRISLPWHRIGTGENDGPRSPAA